MPFDLFSSRSKSQAKPSLYVYDSVPKPFRVQVSDILERVFGKRYYPPTECSQGSVSYQAWFSVRRHLRRELGKRSLSKKASESNPRDECLYFFIDECETSEALDFIDLTFQVVVGPFRRQPTHILENAEVEISPDDAVAELNYRFDQHHLGYQFTGKKLMLRDSHLIHKEVTEPTVHLLVAPGFEGPNEEFLRAHKAYLQGKNKEAIREALNAFESTLKAIFVKRQWQFDPKRDTSSKLVQIAFDQGLVPGDLQGQFTSLRATLETGVPTLRNRYGGHGQGADPVEVPNHLAAYALHLTGSAIVFLVAAHSNLK